jgi:hypothetical protein
MEIYRGREIQTEQLNDGKWIVCAQDNNGVMVVARPGWHYMTEEDGIEDVERLIDQSLERRHMKTGWEANALRRSGRFTQMQVQPVEHTM